MDPKAADILINMGISLVDPAPGIAARIQSLKHFKAFLLATPRAKRKPAYDALLPHLTPRFNVPSYSLLFGSSLRRRSPKLRRIQ